jgi:magnesium transporter
VLKPHVQQQPIDEITDLIRLGRWTEVASRFERLHPSDAAVVLLQLPSRQQRTIFRLLSHKAAASLLPYLPYYDQFALLRAKPGNEMRQIINDMDPDDRMRLLDELPENAWQQLVSELTVSERELTDRLSMYPPNSAGRYLTPNFVSLLPSMRAAEALEHIRKKGAGKETVDE